MKREINVNTYVTPRGVIHEGIEYRRLVHPREEVEQPRQQENTGDISVEERESLVGLLQESFLELGLFTNKKKHIEVQTTK